MVTIYLQQYELFDYSSTIYRVVANLLIFSKTINKTINVHDLNEPL